MAAVWSTINRRQPWRRAKNHRDDKTKWQTHRGKQRTLAVKQWLWAAARKASPQTILFQDLLYTSLGHGVVQAWPKGAAGSLRTWKEREREEWADRKWEIEARLYRFCRQLAGECRCMMKDSRRKTGEQTGRSTKDGWTNGCAECSLPLSNPLTALH